MIATRRLTYLPLILASAVLSHAAGEEVCADGAIAERILCIENQDPSNPFKGQAASQLKSPCRAQRSWRRFQDASTLAAAKSARDKIAELLASRCEQFGDLAIADEFLRKGRYDDALLYYSKISKLSSDLAAPEFAERARRGAITAVRLGKTLILPPPAVLELEGKKKFEDAYREITWVRPETDLHRQNLAALLAAMQAAKSYQEHRDFDRAQTIFAGVLPRLDPYRDRALAEYARSELDRLQGHVLEEANREANSLIAVGDIQDRRGDYAGAASSYEKAAGKKQAISPAIAERANQKAAAARQAAAREPTWTGTWRTFVAALLATVVRVVGYIPYVLAYCIVLFALLCAASLIMWALPARKEVSLSLEDRTGPASAAANSSATEQMQREMRLPQPKGKGLQIETADDGGSSLGRLRIGVPLSALDNAFAVNAPVAFGPLSINPLQIIQLFKPLLRRRYQCELTGTLTASGSDTVCVVNLARFSKKPRPENTRWEAVGSGPDAKAQVIRAVAMQILVDIDPHTRDITSNWRSLNGLREGLDLMRKQGSNAAARRETWNLARACFGDSVLADPDNWLARFNLGTLLNKLGLNALAAGQFLEVLEDDIPAHYRAAAKYNRAAALQKSDDDHLAGEALRLLDEILSDPALDPLLRRLAQSGKLATWADRLVRRKRALKGSRASKEAVLNLKSNVTHWCGQAVAALGQLESEVEADRAHSEDNNVVITVTLNAAGQLKDLSGRPQEAREYLRRAITLMPAFIEATLNLAALYIDRKRSLDPHWAIRAEDLLRCVRSAEPLNTRAAILLGLLYAHPIFGRTGDAVTQLGSALPDPLAARRLGGLLLETGKPAEAVAPLLSAIEQEPRQGISNFLLALCALDLPPADQRRCKLLERSEKWLQDRLDEPASKETRYARVLADVRTARAGCPNPAREDNTA